MGAEIQAELLIPLLWHVGFKPFLFFLGQFELRKFSYLARGFGCDRTLGVNGSVSNGRPLRLVGGPR